MVEYMSQTPRGCTPGPWLNQAFEEWSSMSTVHEEWRPVVGYEGYYSVSNLGRVRRDKGGQRCRAGRILMPSLMAGYPKVSLSCQGKVKSHYIHALVVEAFFGERPEGFVVNHKNGIKTHSHLENLEYVSHQQNRVHAFATGLCVPTTGEKHSTSKLSNQQVEEIRALKGKLMYRDIAVLYEVSASHISDIQNYKTRKCG